MSKTWILFLWILTSCGPLVKVSPSYIAPELMEGTVIQYAEEFFQYCGGREKVPFIAIVSRLPEPEENQTASAARCVIRSFGGGGAVYMRLEYWLRINDNQRRALVWHELAHCALGKPHADNDLMRGDGIEEKEAEILTVAKMREILGCH